MGKFRDVSKGMFFKSFEDMVGRAEAWERDAERERRCRRAWERDRSESGGLGQQETAENEAESQAAQLF